MSVDLSAVVVGELPEKHRPSRLIMEQYRAKTFPICRLN
jgi:hypothetical protein